jgi:hypothetical protein
MQQGLRMRSAIQMIGLLSPLAAFAGIAPAAAAPRDSPEARQACTPEVFRLCNDFVPDTGKITACLERNHASLVPACRRFISGPAPRGHKRPRYVRHIYSTHYY